MDFSNFDPTDALIKTDHLTGNNVGDDDDEERPFGDENPCLLCGNKAFANYIDLNLPTSATATSSTPVRKKLKDILKKNWVPMKDNNILCLACYDLVDRYDGLEAQLNNLRENIEEKYIKTCAKHPIKIKNVVSLKTKRGRPKTKDSKGAKKPKKTVKSEGGSEEDKEDEYVTAFHDDRDDDSDYSTGGNDMDQSHGENQTGQDKMTLPGAIPPKPPEEPPANMIYDENPQMFQRGQKMRLGTQIKADNGMDMYKCAYCQFTVPDVPSLFNHVHSYHLPELVDVAIPAELELGNTMNSGVQLQNVTEPPEGPKEWACIYCDAAFKARTNMSNHFKDKHTPHKPFKCSECQEAFRKSIDLNRHKLYFCPQRTTTFAPKRKYKKREPKDCKPNKKKSNGKNESPENSD